MKHLVHFSYALVYSQSPSANMECPIMKLPDDCLIEIFTHLTNLRDKLRLESVCVRFARLSKKSASWKGSERLNIRIDAKRWSHLYPKPFLCEINEMEFRSVNLSQALHSILSRTDIHHLIFNLKSCDAAFTSAQCVFSDTVAQIVATMKLYASKFKLLSYEYTANNNIQLRSSFQLIVNSFSSLKTLKYSVEPRLVPSRQVETFKEIFACASRCESLEVFRFACHREHYFEKLPDELLLSSLIHKPLKELHIISPAVNKAIEEKFATICNMVTGPGITHITMQRIYNIGGFLNQLNQRARFALLELTFLELKCKLETVLQYLPMIAEILPNFCRIIVDVLYSSNAFVTSAMFLQAVTGYFDGLENHTPSSHVFELYLVIITDCGKKRFKEQLAQLCVDNQINITCPGPGEDHHGTVLEKENVKLMIQNYHAESSADEHSFSSSDDLSSSDDSSDDGSSRVASPIPLTMQKVLGGTYPRTIWR